MDTIFRIKAHFMLFFLGNQAIVITFTGYSSKVCVEASRPPSYYTYISTICLFDHKPKKSTS